MESTSVSKENLLVQLGEQNSTGMDPLYCLSNQTRNGSCNLQPCEAGNCSNNTTQATENPYILVWYLQLIYIVVFVSMVLVAAGGNIIVIWIVMAHKRMRTVTNYFLVNLAVADALISILNTLFNFIYMLYSDWPFGRTYCKFTQFIAPCTISASVFTFMAIAIDRYMAIIHPLNPRMRAHVVLILIAGIWLVSIIIAFPNLLYAEIHTWQYTNSTRTLCYLLWPDGVYQTTDFAYNIFIMLVNYVAPMVALGVTYTRVGVELWGSQAIGERTSRQEESVRSKRRVVKMMIVVVIIFAVCWLPQHVFFLVVNQYPHMSSQKNIQHVYLAIYWLAMSNSMYNPIIYCWMNARFRKGFMYVFRWMPCIKYDANDTVVRTTFHSVRMSVTDTKYTDYGYGRNGSMMHTIVDSIDSSSNSSNVHSGGFHKAHWEHVKRNNFPPLKEDSEREASV